MGKYRYHVRMLNKSHNPDRVERKNGYRKKQNVPDPILQDYLHITWRKKWPNPDGAGFLNSNRIRIRK